MKGKFPNGLRAALDGSDVNQSELSRRIGATRQDIQRWKDGERRLKPETAVLIADALKTTVQKLLLISDDGLPETALEGRVGAGGAIIDIDADTSDLPRIEVVSGDPQAAVLISGDSLGKFEGWYAVIGKRAAFREELYGQLCVVQTVDGEFFIKWIARTKGKGVKLISGDDTVQAESVELKWAAPVIGMRPPKKL